MKDIRRGEKWINRGRYRNKKEIQHENAKGENNEEKMEN
jgi:hypothetical protein